MNVTPQYHDCRQAVLPLLSLNMSLLKQILLVLALASVALPVAGADTAKVIKVLPQFIDLEGRNALSPSLYDRDAYQAFLRKNPEKRSGMQFAVQWKAKTGAPLKLKVELRGDHAGRPTTAVVEESVQHKGWFSSWTNPKIAGDGYKQFGELTAWRATLWQGDTLLSEQKSFLW
jgi:hypothetical protein